MNVFRGLINGAVAGAIIWAVLVVALFYGFRITL